MEMLSKEEKQELKSLYAKLSTLHKERASLEVLKKNRENTLKEEIASVCEIKNKQGEIQANRVKMPLISSILDELYREKPNKKEEEISTYETYKDSIKSKKVNEDCIKSFLSVVDSLEENKSNIKEIYKESSILSKEILEALNEVLKEEFKNALNDELEQNGYEVKEAKDKSEIEELKLTLLEVLKK
ncbi:hypothetical protein [Helicobacter ganmani]|uniref:hypothetical protein n=1 Tax=Helicobacter ganmani TaxID=60246 RepID=UPI003A884245